MVKIRFVVEGSSLQHLDNVTSFSDLELRAARKSSSNTGICLHVLEGQSCTRLFAVHDEDDFKKLEQCAREGVAAQKHKGSSTFRVRVLVSSLPVSPQGESQTPENLPRKHLEAGCSQEPECKRACIRELPGVVADGSKSPIPAGLAVRCAVTPPPLNNSVSVAPGSNPRSTQSWDQDILLSIKRTVTKLHFGSRLPISSLAA